MTTCYTQVPTQSSGQQAGGGTPPEILRSISECTGIVPFIQSSEGCFCENENWDAKDKPDVKVVADIEFELDLYNCTMVAAMGCLEINLNEELLDRDVGGVENMQKHKGMRLPVHPVWVLLLCVPLFASQLLLLCLMELDAKFQEPIYKPGSDAKSTLLAKVLLVAILQVMMFQEVQETLKALVFLLNPTTWTDVIRKYPHRMNFDGVPAAAKGLCTQFRWIWSWPCLFLPSFAAILFKMGVAYLVTVESVSVILQCDQAQHAIFNALALTFVADLDVVVWGVLKGIFRLQLRSAFQQPDSGNFRFYATPTEKMGPCWLQVYRHLTRLKGLNKNVAGRQIERWLCFLLLFLIYFHTLNFVVYAWDTNVLPLTRDTCSFIGWSTGLLDYYEVSQPMRLLHWCRTLLFRIMGVDLCKELKDKTPLNSTISLFKYCEGKNLTDTWKKSPKMPSDITAIATLWYDDSCGLWYRWCLGALVLVVLLPQLFGLFAAGWLKLLHLLGEKEDDPTQGNEQEPRRDVVLKLTKDEEELLHEMLQEWKKGPARTHFGLT